MSMTRREEIIGVLEKNPISVQELATMFHVEIGEILEHLEHIKLSIKPKKLKVDPAFCKYCGFVFKERKRLKTPTKCPKCRKEWIHAAMFSVK
jgi:transcriptional regulator